MASDDNESGVPEAEGRSDRDTEIAAIGRQIDDALDLEQRGDVLARWMAYRLAELRRSIAQTSSPESKAALQAEHDDLILALWKNRHAIPGGVDMDRRIADSLAALDILEREQALWLTARAGPETIPNMLLDLRHATSGLVLAQAVLAQQLYERAHSPEDPEAPLSDVEHRLRYALRAARQRVPMQIRFKVMGDEETEPTPEQETDRLRQDFSDKIGKIRALLDKLEQAVVAPNAGAPCIVDEA